jgi:hypothetical protein
MGTPAKCIPVRHVSFFDLRTEAFKLIISSSRGQCATALAATFDVELVEEVGEKLLAPEAKLRAASVTLAPTCNIQRVFGSRFASISVY